MVAIKHKSTVSALSTKLFARYTKKVCKPLMVYEEIEIIKRILSYLQPKKCLEWGAGYSTIYFPKFLKKNARWFAVEHQKEWSERISDANKNTSVKIFHIPPNHFPWSDKNHDGAYSDLKDYIEFPSMFGEFDFILVDGRARKACLYKAYELVKKNDLVILHDAERSFYHQPFALYKYQVMLSNYNYENKKLWLGSKGIDIMNTVMNNININKINIKILAKVPFLKRR